MITPTLCQLEQGLSAYYTLTVVWHLGVMAWVLGLAA